MIRPVFVALLVSARLAVAQDVATRIDQYMTALTSLHRFSGAVLVARRGQPLISRGYGVAQAEWDIPNTPDTKFRVGSITKQFTAMAILMLQERGKLLVSDRICKYVLACPVVWRSITIHQLLTHTSGIADFTDFTTYPRIERFPITPAALVDSCKGKPLDFPPGTRYQYSNSGYAVLGLIVERVSGQSYAAFLAQNIFAPIGMRNTGYDSNAAILAHRAAGYGMDGGTLRNAPYIDMSIPYAAGALYSTVEDLLRWDQALYTEQLVSRRSLEAAFTPYKGIVGYGWAIERQFDRRMISHEGGIHGFVGKIARFPDDSVTIIVLSNLETTPITVVSRDLAAIVFGAPYEMPHERLVVHLEPAQLDGYRGRYRVDAAPDVVVTIDRRGDALLCRVQSQSFVLDPESDTTFTTDDGAFTVIFSKDAAGRIGSLTVNGEYHATRVAHR